MIFILFNFAMSAMPARAAEVADFFFIKLLKMYRNVLFFKNRK